MRTFVRHDGMLLSIPFEWTKEKFQDVKRRHRDAEVLVQPSMGASYVAPIGELEYDEKMNAQPSLFRHMI